MADDILTKPYLQNQEFYALAAREVTLPGGVWTPIVQQNAQRYAFLIEPGTLSGPPPLSTVPVGPATVSLSRQNTLPVIVHGAAYPLWVTGVWYAYDGVGGTVYVTELVRREGA